MNSDLEFLAPHGHICWAYEDPAAFEEQARSYLAQGLAAGERVWYVADGDRSTLISRLSAIDGFAAALTCGAADVVSLGEAYDYGSVIEPEHQVRAYRAATEAALAAGYRGLRVAADVTALIGSAEQVDAFARYEHLIDRYMRTAPMAAMCAYSRTVLGSDVIAQLACMHPATNADDVLFRLCAGDEADSVTVAGELDPSHQQLLATALTRVDLRPVDGELVFQAPELRFIDHRCLIELHEYARRRDADVVLRTPHTAAARVVDMLGLGNVRVEAA